MQVYFKNKQNPDEAAGKGKACLNGVNIQAGF
jgi:hypothetical protein